MAHNQICFWVLYLIFVKSGVKQNLLANRETVTLSLERTPSKILLTFETFAQQSDEDTWPDQQKRQ